MIFRKNRSGYTEKTKENLMTGAGAYFKNFNYGVDTYESAIEAGKLLGATQGGGQFTAKATVRQVEVDGVSGKAKGLEEVDSWEVSILANLLEVNKDTLALALGICSIDETDGKYVKLTGKNYIDDEDYLSNVTFIGTISGSSEPVIVQVFNALNTDGLDLKMEDKKEAVIATTFYGHYDANSLDEPPYAIYYPKKGNVEKPIASLKSGTYTGTKQVTITCNTSGAEIHYTTNGFEPSKTDETYSTPISISKNTILKAKAFKTSMPDSSTLVETYIIE